MSETLMTCARPIQVKPKQSGARVGTDGEKRPDTTNAQTLASSRNVSQQGAKKNRPISLMQCNEKTMQYEQ